MKMTCNGSQFETGTRVRVIFVPLVDPQRYVNREGIALGTATRFGTISGIYEEVRFSDGTGIFAIVEEL